MNRLDMICSLIFHLQENTTNLVLQKLLYFIQAYTLATTDDTAFEENIEAWMYGPVVPSVYRNLKRDKDYYKNEDFNELNNDITAIVEAVVENLGELDPFKLVDITHSYDPWITTWNGYGCKIISKNDIRDYHKKRHHNGSGMF